MKIINESYAPEVGPFYVIDGVVFADTDDLRDVDNYGGFKDSDNDHYSYWKSLQRIYREFRNIDYDYYPRGRVVYNANEDIFYLYVDECVQDMKNIHNIIDELGLPTRKVVVSSDEHYQCHDCNKEYHNIEENYQD